MRSRYAFLTLFCVVMSGCQNGNATTQPSENGGFAGTWKITFSSGRVGPMTMKWVASQNARQLSGDVTLTKGSLTLSGSMTGAALATTYTGCLDLLGTVSNFDENVQISLTVARRIHRRVPDPPNPGDIV